MHGRGQTKAADHRRNIRAESDSPVHKRASTSMVIKKNKVDKSEATESTR